VRTQTATLQQALDASLNAWLHNLKRTAEQEGRWRFGPHARHRPLPQRYGPAGAPRPSHSDRALATCSG